MVKKVIENQFRSVVSIEPLLRFWEKNLVPECSHMASMYEELKEQANRPLSFKERSKTWIFLRVTRIFLYH